MRKERKGGENSEKQKLFRKEGRGKNMNPKVRLEERLKPKEGKQSKNENHTKKKKKWTKGRKPNVGSAEQKKMGWYGKHGNEKGKVLMQRSQKNKNGEEKRGEKKGGRKRNEGGNLSKRIPSKFFQRVTVGSSKEVATVHATQEGRKVCR